MEELLEFKASLEDAQEKGVAIFGEIVKAEFSRVFGAIAQRLDTFEQTKVEAISAEEHEIEILAAATAHQERVKVEKAGQEAAYAESIKTGDQTKIDLIVAKNKANVVAGVVDALTSSAADEVIGDSAIDESPSLEIPAKGKK